MMLLARYELTGIVQGVGFRPALCLLARAAGLGGSVRNREGRVLLELQGEAARLNDFIESLPSRLKPPIRIELLRKISQEMLPQDYCLQTFEIAESEAGDAVEMVIPADLALCPDCLREILEPAARRYAYPFTSCTACGPRYTVINEMPYDRSRTTMSVFPLCRDCEHEYRDPKDRRFHAESIACPHCGPELSLLDQKGNLIGRKDALRESRAALAQGRTLALRGLGGFQLVADAFNCEALKLLRERKNRPHKPFAVMVRSMEILRKYCELSVAEEELLSSPAAPIVILRLKALTPESFPAELLSPDSRTLGVMLPYTPLHLLLFEQLPGDPVSRFEMLVMTSGNRGGEPICLSTKEALDRLGGIADLILTHDREINLRNDDSLAVLRGASVQILRRARGYAPAPLRLPQRCNSTVLAMGAELKNAIALAYDESVVLSPHIGDLETPEAVDGLAQVAEALQHFLKRKPEKIAVDLHPDFQSTRLGVQIAKRLDIPVSRVQHHHAHAAACLAEHGLSEGLALVFDGTGLGTDGSIWGAELLKLNSDASFERLASFAGSSLPGGDAAIRQPARQLVARLVLAGVGINEEQCRTLGVTQEEAALWGEQARRGLNAPVAHSAGRLFDSFSALLGLAPARTSYEGQAAIRVESAAEAFRRSPDFKDSMLPEIPFLEREGQGMLWIDWTPAFQSLAHQRELCSRNAALALAFHHSLARAALRMLEFGLAKNPACRNIALSGGVFMNGILHELVTKEIAALGLVPLVHSATPPNDGCVAFGQAVLTGIR